MVLASEVVSKWGRTSIPAARPIGNKNEPSKLTFRLQTWNKLERLNQVLFPKPCKFRIPRFKGENDAVKKLVELEAFNKAKVVKVNLDKAQEKVRLKVIQSGKSLIVSTPGLKEAVFLLLDPPLEANNLVNRMAASRIGIRRRGTALDFASGIKVDLIVLGAVAVDKKGHHIGKGGGFTDLEYALLSKLAIIEPDATIVTVVHDLQVYEELPENIFKAWDVPVDIIVTPTQVIQVGKKLPRPTLTWNLLKTKRVNDIPIIRLLLNKDQRFGKKVELKEDDSDTEGTHIYWPPMGYKRRRARFIRRQRLTSVTTQIGIPCGAMNRGSYAPPPRTRTRTFYQQNRRQTMPSNGLNNKPMKKRTMQMMDDSNSTSMEEAVDLLQGLVIKTGKGNTSSLKVEGVKPILPMIISPSGTAAAGGDACSQKNGSAPLPGEPPTLSSPIDSEPSLPRL